MSRALSPQTKTSSRVRVDVEHLAQHEKYPSWACMGGGGKGVVTSWEESSVLAHWQTLAEQANADLERQQKSVIKAHWDREST